MSKKGCGKYFTGDKDGFQFGQHCGDISEDKEEYVYLCPECEKSKEEIVYKCGHKSEPIILDNNELSVTAWLEWKDSVGFDGDKSMCWNCFCKKSTKSELNSPHPSYQIASEPSERIDGGEE